MRLAIGTCRQLPEPDPDQLPLLAALRRAGAEAELIAWDAGESASGFDLCVLRSTWDYYHEPERFLDWVDRVAAETRLLNPAPVVHWNAHKSYLRKLASQGVPIIPTEFVERGGCVQLIELLDQHGWDDVVIKPSVSAASYGTRRFSRQEAEAGQAFLDEIAIQRDMMIQRYMPEVDGTGERCLVWIDGEVTHAIRKEPRFAGGVERISEALPVSAAEREFAARTMRGFKDRCLYGRIDVMQDESGEMRLSELELIEPSLFLLQHAPAMERLVSAIIREAE